MHAQVDHTTVLLNEAVEALVTDPDGFFGVNGLFRFRIDGTSERGLAVMQIQPGGAELVEGGVQSFPTGQTGPS